MTVEDISDFLPVVRKGSPRVLSGRKAGLVALGVAWGLVLAILILVVPKFEDIFKDFGVEVSVLTGLAIRASHVSGLFVAAVACLIVAHSLVLDELSRRKDGEELARAWSWLMFTLPLLSIGFLAVALVSALVGLISKLSG